MGLVVVPRPIKSAHSSLRSSQTNTSSPLAMLLTTTPKVEFASNSVWIAEKLPFSLVTFASAGSTFKYRRKSLPPVEKTSSRNRVPSIYASDIS